MEVSVENAGGLARRMRVRVPAERIDQEVVARLQSMARTIRMDGFRSGKIPLKVVERKYGAQVRLEVANQVLNSTLQEAMTRENLRPAGSPSIETETSSPGKPLEYVATFEIFPEFNAPVNYGFSISRPVVEITATDVDAMLENLQKQRATWNRVDRQAQLGDQLTLDYEATIDGAPFTGNQASNMQVVLGSGSMIAGFEEQLTGLAAGDTRTFSLTFPAGYPSVEVAGKEAEFKVAIRSVAEISLPALDDAFADTFGIAGGGMQGLREEVTNNLRRELKGLLSSRLKAQVFDALLEHNSVDVPQQLVKDEVEVLKKQQGDGAIQRAPEELESVADKRVRLGVIVSEVAKRNHIVLDQDKVRETVATIAASYEKPEEVIQWYYGNQEMLHGVQSNVIEGQVVDWIVEHAGITVVDQPMSFNELVEEARRTQGLQP
jgi:trigger factor